MQDTLDPMSFRERRLLVDNICLLCLVDQLCLFGLLLVMVRLSASWWDWGDGRAMSCFGLGAGSSVVLFFYMRRLRWSFRRLYALRFSHSDATMLSSDTEATSAISLLEEEVRSIP